MGKVTAKKKVKAAKKTAKPAKPAKKKAVPAKKAVKKTAKPAAKKATAKKTVKAVAKKSVKAKPVKKSAPVKAAAPKVQPAKPVAKIDYTKAITPLGDRLVIRLTQTERVTPGGLILPDSVSSTSGYLKGEVLAAGHGTYTKKGHHKLLDVKIGDVVLFNEYSSTKVKYNNEDLHIVHESDILGVTK
ncbi:GroES family chaperonin [Pseudobdellovibrio sp. HCB154]|uniref:GroES family chaperonin n=1 Tax=Pseudobdellovibrio sp. HCB154 TaxID=3386277 RepID=UPI00391706DF